MERLPAVAAICEDLKLPGLSSSAAKLAQHKLLMRQSFAQAGIQQPKFLGLTLGEDDKSIFNKILHVGLPAVLKPVGGAGSGGVYVIREEHEVLPALASLRNMMTRSNKTFGYFPGELIVEGYLRGPQYSIEGYVQNGVTNVISATEKFVAEDTIEVGHLVPARVDCEDFASIISLSKLSVDALNLSDCLFHLEVSKTSQRFEIIEMNARMGGGCIATHLIPVALGIDMVQVMCNIACGDAVVVKRNPQGKFAAATFVRGLNEGSVRNIKGVDKAAQSVGVVAVIHEVAISQILAANARAADDRPCVVVTSGLTPESALEYGRLAAQQIEIEIDYLFHRGE